MQVARDEVRVNAAPDVRFAVHYTPKHGSWLNAAEIEASLVASECLGRQRISWLVDLIS